tara:strand:+ start:1415 stop:2425 length:1011 start_codon:yes stop_codon:yes gene_type:complete
MQIGCWSLKVGGRMKYLTSKILLLSSICISQAFGSNIFTSRKALFCGADSMSVKPKTEKCKKATIDLFESLNVSSTKIESFEDYVGFKKLVKAIDLIKQKIKNGTEIRSTQATIAREKSDAEIKIFTTHYLIECQDEESIQDLLLVGECATQKVQDYVAKKDILGMDKACQEYIGGIWGLLSKEYREPNCGRVDEQKVADTLSELDKLLENNAPLTGMTDIETVCQFRYEVRFEDSNNFYSAIVPVFDKSNPSCVCAFDYKALESLDDEFGGCIADDKEEHVITESMESIKEFGKFVMPNARLPEGSQNTDRDMVHPIPQDAVDIDNEIFAPVSIQ